MSCLVNQAEGLSSRAPPEYQKVMRSDLNVAPARDTRSARVVEVDSDSDVEFQDSREVLPIRSLADSIAVPRVPQATTSETMQPSSTGLLTNITRNSLNLEDRHRFSVQKKAQVLVILRV